MTAEESTGSSQQNDETEIVYVPGAKNRYLREHDVAVLDEELEDYPLAHEVIKEHELDHANPENQGVVGLVAFEFRTGLYRHFGTDDHAEEVREYLKEANESQIPNWKVLLFVFVDSLRSGWNSLMLPLGRLYRTVVQLREQPSPEADRSGGDQQ